MRREYATRRSMARNCICSIQLRFARLEDDVVAPQLESKPRGSRPVDVVSCTPRRHWMIASRRLRALQTTVYTISRCTLSTG